MTNHRLPHPFSPETLDAVAELLQAAEQYGLGVAFQPDDDGWRVSYILGGWPAYEEYELPAGRLSNAFDLHIASSAALKPLIDVGERAERFFAEQDGRS